MNILPQCTVYTFKAILYESIHIMYEVRLVRSTEFKRGGKYDAFEIFKARTRDIVKLPIVQFAGKIGSLLLMVSQ